MTPDKSCVAALLLLGALFSGSAAAHGVRFGFGFGFPLFPPAYYYPAPVYYYPPTVLSEPAPQLYVERNESPAAAPAAENYWYYCPDSQAYYPYVRQCAGAWQRVSPRPPDLR